MKNNNVNSFYVAILYKPVRNMASIKFVRSLGFKRVGRVINKDQHIWGIYKKELDK